MTKTEFNVLKVGARVGIPDTNRPGMLMGTEALAIDRLFGKLTVLCGRRPYSYRYVRINPPIQRIGLCVGMCR